MDFLAMLKECLSYDPCSGEFVWIKGQRKGRRAGAVDKDGYLQIQISGRIHKAHRLAWLVTHGECPGLIDHINGIKSDNRIANLRPLSKTLNAQNLKKATSRNVSGLLGVTTHLPGKWRARIRANGRAIHLGVFCTPEAAHVAYVEAKRLLHPGGLL